MRNFNVGRYLLLKKFILLLLTCIILAACSVYADNNAETKGSDWVEIELEKKIPLEKFAVYKKLYKKENFELIGKMMTLFFRDKDKAYKFKNISQNKFFVRSRSTIRKGSIINIEEMNSQYFRFTGNFKIQKGIKFDCQVKVIIKYEKTQHGVKSITNIAYKAPGFVEGFDKLYKAFTGQHFMSNKINNFVDRFNLVGEKLIELDSQDWKELINNRELLDGLYFPVEFTVKEKKIINYIIKSNN